MKCGKSIVAIAVGWGVGEARYQVPTGWNVALNDRYVVVCDGSSKHSKQIEVEWRSPASNGGAAITSYSVIHRLAGGTASDNTTAATIGASARRKATRC